MLKTIKRSLPAFFIGIQLFFSSTYSFIKLSEFDFGSASVLPTYTKRNVKYVILSREALGRSKKGTYDDFGGAKDPDEYNPLVTAAREFNEEAIIPATLGLDLEETMELITKNCRYVIGYIPPYGNSQVTYIINFNQYYKQFIENFYDAYNNALDEYIKEKNRLTFVDSDRSSLKMLRANIEKNRLALVNWNSLKQAICNSQYNTGVTVDALVIDPVTRVKNKETILLRPFFVAKLKGFMCDKPYIKGENKKIRYYSRAAQTSATTPMAEESWFPFVERNDFTKIRQ